MIKRTGGWVRVAIVGLGLLAGCSSGTEPVKQDPVAAVVITNQPTSPLLVGNTIQLVASAVNATGGTIAGATFSWASSQGTIATVSTGGLVTAVGAGGVTITATSGGKSGTALLDVRAGGSLGTAGGVLTLMNGQVTLTVPAGGLNQTVNFLVRPVPDPVQNPRIVPGTVIEVGPEGTFFQRLVGLAIRADPAKVPAGLSESSLQLYALINGAWRLVAGSTVSAATHTVSGSIATTGTYGVASTAVDHVILGGSAVGGALYAGQTGQLTATAYDEDGHALPGRGVTWSSSDQAVATVANGTVTAVGAGSATITAASEGKAASTSLQVLPRPTADWSQATEWVTHQADPAHTGFVAATLDPVVFTERWVKSPVLDVSSSPVPLNPVTFGPGSVFGSSVSYSGTQRAFALDLATGAPRWSVGFGTISGVHPPAYADGRVYLTTSGQGDSYLYAFDAATGAQLFRSPYGNQWSLYYAPVVVGQTVYMAGGTYDGMYSFDGTTGAQRWFAATNQYNQWTPAVRNGLVYAYTGSNSPQVEVVDAVTGAVTDIIPDPHFSWDGWSMNTAPVLGGSNDLLATQAGRLVSFDLQVKTVRWEKPGEFRGTVAVAAGVLYVVNGGQLEARNEPDGALLWTWKPNTGQLQPTVLVTKNLVFTRADDATYAVDLAARRQVWSYPAGGQLSLSAQGVLLIARPDGKLSAVTVR